MRITHTFTLLLALFSFSTVASTHRIEISKEMTPRTLNGQKVESNWIKSDSSVELGSGINQLVVTIGQIVVEDGRRTKYYSQPYILLFETNDSLSLSYETFRTIEDARQFEKNPQFELTNSTGKQVNFKIDSVHIGGLQTRQDFESSIKKYNENGRGEAVLSHSEPIASLRSSTSSKDTHTISSVKSGFLSLNEMEQRRFMGWALENLK
ncbi:DUF2057 domain-containing protein [Vibrio penaeicida]|uniref:YccT family protein n=1 Tax=Vibrio penaeicida TaxID=104609 RepID=UPI0027336850|nr:DUF2057 domain-containing protein [Vibrio penaeicida]MDP2575110.1 DUF2057 domain-containing protein [Vibrio penaeicida]